MITAPSAPALRANWRIGSSSARRRIWMPNRSSSLLVVTLSSAGIALINATPPPGLAPPPPLHPRPAPRQLGQPLLQLLTVEVTRRRLDLGADLLDPRANR